MSNAVNLDNEREIARIRTLGKRESVLAYHDIALRESAARKAFVAALEDGMADADPEQFRRLAEGMSNLSDLLYDLNQILIGRMFNMFAYEMDRRRNDAH